MPLYASSVARLTGTTIKALRVYENNGLLPVVKRDSNGWRVYSGEHLLRVETIKALQNAGLSLSQIAQTLAVGKQQTVWQEAEIALKKQIKQAEAKLAQLRKLRESLDEADTVVALSSELTTFKARLLAKGYPPELAQRSIRTGQLLQIMLSPGAWEEVMADMYHEIEKLDSQKLAIARQYVHLAQCEEGSHQVEEWVRSVIEYVTHTKNYEKFTYESLGLNSEADSVLSELWEADLSVAQLRANRLLEKQLSGGIS